MGESNTRGENDKKPSVDLTSRISPDMPKPKKLALDRKTLKDVASSQGSDKISPSLRAIVEKMMAHGITRQNARELGASDLSSPLVKVNKEGNIQTYIHVLIFGAEERALLESYEIIIEIVNAKLGIIQAWVPFDRIDEVAKLPFVKRITPPNYGTPRVGGMTTKGNVILSYH